MLYEYVIKGKGLAISIGNEQRLTAMVPKLASTAELHSQTHRLISAPQSNAGVASREGANSRCSMLVMEIHTALVLLRSDSAHYFSCTFSLVVALPVLEPQTCRLAVVNPPGKPWSNWYLGCGRYS